MARIRSARPISLAITLVAALMTWWSRSSMKVKRTPLSGGLTRLWVILQGVVWTVIVLPYVMVGPPDLDAYVTGVTIAHIDGCNPSWCAAGVWIWVWVRRSRCDFTSSGILSLRSVSRQIATLFFDQLRAFNQPLHSGRQRRL